MPAVSLRPRQDRGAQLYAGLLLANPHDLCSYWSVRRIEIVPSLPIRGGRKAGIC